MVTIIGTNEQFLITGGITFGAAKDFQRFLALAPGELEPRFCLTAANFA